MKKKINDHWTQYLLQSPESGMGYQQVDVYFTDGSMLDRVMVFNAEDIDLPQPYLNKEIKQIMIHPGGSR